MPKRSLGWVLLGLGLSGMAWADSGYRANYQSDTGVFHFNGMERLSRGQVNALASYDERVRGTLFEMYPSYWQLNAQLSGQRPETIVSFVRRYAGSVMAEKLVADYAEAKASQGDYESVRAVANFIENADSSEACAMALGYNQHDGLRTLLEKDNVWLNTQLMPNLCQKLADEMTYNQHISQEDRKNRLIRMLRLDGRVFSSGNKITMNKTQQIVLLARQLGVPIAMETILHIRQNPRAFLSNFDAYANSQAGQYLYIYAISQLAYQSYHSAIAQLEQDIARDGQHGQRLSGMARRYAYRSIAVWRMNHNTDHGFDRVVLSWFQKSLGEPFNFEEAEDYAQAAIHFGAWQDVKNAIGLMSPIRQRERIWQYWLARSHEKLGNPTEAQAIYQKLATSDLDYYGLLARERLGLQLTLQDIGGQLPHVGANEEAYVMSDEHFARAILMMKNNAHESYTNREWNWAVKKARDSNNTQLTLFAAKMAQDMGNYSRSIYAIDNSPNLRNAAVSHPMPYQRQLVDYSRRAGIDPAWAYGIIRQESRFQTAAQSSKKAQGLMQIIPETARLIARRLSEPVGNMNHPDTNIRYGTWYLANNVKSAGSVAVATAGYNAGPKSANAWRPKHGSIEADQYVEAIPYVETRPYVKHVMTNATIYGVLLGNYVPIGRRMGVVSPSL